MWLSPDEIPSRCGLIRSGSHMLTAEQINIILGCTVRALDGAQDRPSSPDEAAKHGVRSAFFSARPSSSQLSEIAKLVDAGKLKPVDETVLLLSEARHAHELNETGHARGKIVLKVASPHYA
jgi:NADPH:quinone reductase-like Zn-dependent oxidoreductase